MNWGLLKEVMRLIINSALPFSSVMAWGMISPVPLLKLKHKGKLEQGYSCPFLLQLTERETVLRSLCLATMSISLVANLKLRFSGKRFRR